MIWWREIYYEGRDCMVPISDPSYLWDKHFPIHIKIICWHPSLAGHVLLISVTQGKGKKEKVKIQTGFQEYWMPSIRFLNTSVALESIYHGEHFIVFGADIQGQNLIPWRELIRIKPNSLPCQNYVMNATLPAPVGLRPSCKSVSLESYWVHLRNTDPVPVVRPGICIEYISQVILMYGLFGVTNLSFNTKLGHGIKDPSQSGPNPSP